MSSKRPPQGRLCWVSDVHPSYAYTLVFESFTADTLPMAVMVCTAAISPSNLLLTPSDRRAGLDRLAAQKRAEQAKQGSLLGDFRSHPPRAVLSPAHTTQFNSLCLPAQRTQRASFPAEQPSAGCPTL